MLRLSALAGILATLLPFTDAAALNPRQAAATQVVALASVENLAVRPNGQILATNMNSPNLYLVDPVAKTQSTGIVISGARGLSGIAEIAPDVFAVIGGKDIFRVDFTGDAPVSELVATMTQTNNLNGLSAFDGDLVLVADAGAGSVYRFDMSTGEYSEAIKDPTMAPTGGIPFGIDGIRYLDGTLWYTNIFANSFHSVPIDETGAASGPVKTHWSNMMGDDLCVGPNGKLYVSTNSGNSLVEVDPAVGTPTPVAQVRGSTSCAFGRGETDANVVYVGGAQGIFAATIE